MIFRFKDRIESNNFYFSVQHSNLFNNNSIEVIRYQEYDDNDEIDIYCVEIKVVKLNEMQE